MLTLTATRTVTAGGEAEKDMNIDLRAVLDNAPELAFYDKLV